MIPAKEKAKELYDKYEILFVNANADSWGKESKQCALIAVEEFLNWDFSAYGHSQKKYWQQVKTEINNL